jgi:hypothetical protein
MSNLLRKESLFDFHYALGGPIGGANGGAGLSSSSVLPQRASTTTWTNQGRHV